MMIQTKKAFAWNWVISGMIIGLVVITIFTSMLNKVFIENARQDADRQFSEIYSRTKTLCAASVGEEDFYVAKIPEIVDAIYISDSKDKDMPKDIKERIENRNTSIGYYLCMKLRDEKPKCRYAGCKVEMSYLGKEETVLSVADRILKKSYYTRHPLTFSKDEEMVHVLIEGSTNTIRISACNTTTRSYCLPNGSCSPPDAPVYCTNCQHCGDNSCNCGETKTSCSQDCESTENEKNPGKYTQKQSFLVSDENWKEVLILVPVTTWTDGTGIHKYPTLLYHKEDSAFDADSIIHFFQQYNPDSLKIIGQSPNSLDNLLTAGPPLGSGISSSKITRITSDSYLTFWESYKNVVYVEDNYELALMASTYASLINAPLIIKNYNDNINFDTVSTLCVGNPSSECDEKYTLEELEQKYITETNTDKIILVNPGDLNIKVNGNFAPDKSSNSISELYSKTSLSAPVLASAKHEIILSTTSANYQQIDSLIESKINNLGINAEYLTIIASPNSIPISRTAAPADDCGWANYLEVDGRYYGELDHDNLIDLSTGRIYGVTVSDASALVARSIFTKDIVTNNFNALLALAGNGDSEAHMISFSEYFWTNNIKSKLDDYYFYAGDSNVNSHSSEIKNLYDDANLIVYHNHGGALGFVALDLWSTTFSSMKIYLNNPIIIDVACQTCIWNSNPYSFCVQNIRRGALGYQGATDISYWNAEFDETLNGFLLEGKSIGKAYKEARNQDYNDDIYNFCTGLRGDIFYAWLGDPTITFWR